jgi:NADP-dependent 3-hydroxy acid dehydrogenase YdfG
VVAVTGSSAGVGRATARAFARRCASIGLFAGGGERLEASRREVEGAGSATLAIRGAHGIFDEQARTRSVQLWAAKNRVWLATVGLAAAPATALRR